MKIGLVSVSFRQLSPQEIIELAVKCGLQGIEWGGDVHVPPDDMKNAQQIGELTRQNGLQSACYGSYYRLTDAENTMAGAVIQTAQALGAPLIRVWAGRCGSAEATEAMRAEVVRNAQYLADAAAEAGVDVAFEWHGGTLTDTLQSAMRLLADVNRSNVHVLWQPPVGMEAEECAAQIRTAGEHIRNIHVFSWNGTERRPLIDGSEKWRRCMAEIDRLPGERWGLLEFVRNDDPAQLKCDAECLRRWLKGEWSE